MLDLPVVVELGGQYYHGVYRVTHGWILVVSCAGSTRARLGKTPAAVRARQLLVGLVSRCDCGPAPSAERHADEE